MSVMRQAPDPAAPAQRGAWAAALASVLLVATPAPVIAAGASSGLSQQAQAQSSYRQPSVPQRSDGIEPRTQGVPLRSEGVPLRDQGVPLRTQGVQPRGQAVPQRAQPERPGDAPAYRPTPAYRYRTPGSSPYDQTPYGRGRYQLLPYNQRFPHSPAAQ